MVPSDRLCFAPLEREEIFSQLGSINISPLVGGRSTMSSCTSKLIRDHPSRANRSHILT